MNPSPTQGRIIAAFGRQYLVALTQNPTASQPAPGTQPAAPWLCFTRGKKSEVACGDWVEVAATGPDQGVIERVQPRSSLLLRANEYRHKLMAANVSQIVIVVATEPGFSDELLTRALVAASSQELAALIVLNKCDLAERLPTARQALAPYIALGYPVLEVSAREDVSTLRQHLGGHTSILVGQSGMGKSTLVNALIPEARAATREISQALDSGKHTTTHARLYPLDASSCLIDSPGLQEFGLAHLAPAALDAGFPELDACLGHCRFRDCQHQREPDCAVLAALDRGEIHPRRFAFYLQMREQLSATSSASMLLQQTGKKPAKPTKKP